MNWVYWMNECLLERVFTLTPSLSLKWRGSKESHRSESGLALTHTPRPFHTSRPFENVSRHSVDFGNSGGEGAVPRLTVPWLS